MATAEPQVIEQRMSDTGQDAVIPDLIEVGARQPLREYLREIWARRDFMVTVPLGDLKARHMDTLLGNAWNLVNPIIFIFIYFLIFGLILGTRRGQEDFLSFLAVGILAWRYTSSSVTSGANVINSNQGLIRSLQFPRAILPISAVVEQTVAFLPAVAVMFAVAIAEGNHPGFAWLLLLPIFSAQALFNIGLAFVAARLTSHFRDMVNFLPHILRVFFYVSGILYSVDRFIQNDIQRLLFEVNPIYSLLSIARAPILGTPTTPGMFISVAGWTAALFFGGFFFFRAAERTYGHE